MKARAAVLVNYNEPLEIREFDVPKPQAGGIVVRIERATLCGTDRHIYAGFMRAMSHTPAILGHEMVGVIDTLGPGRMTDTTGAPLSPGDRVIWTYGYCGKCFYCALAHQPTLCSNLMPYGYGDCSKVPHLLGGFCQYAYILPECHVVKVPDDVPSHWAASASCALRTVMHATNRAGGIRSADTVLVQGSGPVGLYAVSVARAMGASTVACFGAPDARMTVAHAFGADAVRNVETTDPMQRKAILLALSGGRGADLVLECSGSHDALEEAFELVRPGGRIAVVGVGDHQPAAFYSMKCVMKQVSVFGVRSAAVEHYREALSFLSNQRHRFDFELLFGKTYGLDEIPIAMESMRRMDEIKPVIDPFK